MIERVILALLLLSLAVIVAKGDEMGAMLPHHTITTVQPGVTTGNTMVTPVRMEPDEPDL